ncbi:hypothetical protein ACRALDRAFT_2034808 [Sodiomyces alcalophilus JCM 7366]|uniref:uncharacterized protein n=1 Tax=Sodiomyces alcalophilus JCM 7366 TaxID=591952 RepID=UPI0039B57C69
MTTSTRSSKRAAAIGGSGSGSGSEKGSGNRRGRGRGQADQQAQHMIYPAAAPHPRRTKRRLNSVDGELDGPASKRSRTDVQIILETRVSNPDPTENEAPKTGSRSSIDTDDAVTQQSQPRSQRQPRPRQRPQPSHTQPNPQPRRQHHRQDQQGQDEQDQQHPPPEPHHHNLTPAAPVVNVTSLPSRSTRAALAGSTDTSSQPPLTKHRAKVVNGIRHELDRLHPGETSDAKEQRGGRKLRSWGNDPKEQHLLNADTPIVVVDSSPRYYQGHVVAPLFTPSLSDPTPAPSHHPPQQGEYPIRGYGDALYEDLFDSQRIDLDFLGNSYKGKTLSEDPLPDELYIPVHKKAERIERSIRNTERGRAQHERDQIVRLLDGLQGQDWLRIMGVSGVTESKKKTFESARDHFIKGCEAILDKFRQIVPHAETGKGEDASQHSSDDGAAKERGGRASRRTEVADSEEDEEEGEQDGHGEDDDTKGNGSEGAEPADDSGVVEGSIAKPARVEGAARSRTPVAKTTTRRRGRAGGAASASAAATAGKTPQTAKAKPTPPPPREFTSFFKKKHERDAALNKHRRAGRRVLAWGQPIPDMGEVEFELPEELMDEELLKARARKKRRELRSRP